MKILATTFLLVALTSSAASAQLTITKQGRTFAIGNPALGQPQTPTFIVFFSYFSGASDRMTNTMLEGDLANLAALGVKGVRIFANYWRTKDCTGFSSYDASGVLQDGSAPYVNPAGLTRLKYVLGRAAAYGIVVELTFARETVAPVGGQFTFNEYTAGINEVTKQLKTTATQNFSHVFFDLQNEANGSSQGPTCPSAQIPITTTAQAWQIIDAVKKDDPSRLASISLANEITPEQYGGIAMTAFPDPSDPGNPAKFRRLDFAAFHDSRQWVSGVPKWTGNTGVATAGTLPLTPPITSTISWGDVFACSPTVTASCKAMLVDRLRNAITAQPMPVFFQEPDRWMPSGQNSTLTANHFLEAVARAKYAGAAAWCMHSQSRFLYVDEAQPPGAPELAFLNALSSTLAQVVWNP